MQYSVVQYCTVQCSAVLHCTVQCSSVRCGADLVVREQRVLVLVDAEVDDNPAAVHVEALVPLLADALARLASGLPVWGTWGQHSVVKFQ